MSLENVQLITQLAVPVAALFATIMGIIVWNSLFRDKVRILFDDFNYIIFFFLSVGYTSFAIGEIMWYLTYTIFGDTSAVSIADVYWTGGSLAILLALIELSRKLYLASKEFHKLILLGSIGLLILAGITSFLFSGNTTNYPFRYIYPLLSGLIVIFSLSIILFYDKIQQFRKSLLFLFFANVAIWIGDLLFVQVNATGFVPGVLTTITDLVYVGGYLLSGIFFTTLLFSFSEHTD